MNGIFGAVFLASALLLLFLDPQAFLPALLSGAEKAAVLALSLLVSYCVWLGFFRVMEACGLSAKLAHAAEPLARRLFRSRDGEALRPACENLAANFLGLPGAPTPLGIRAVRAFSAAKNDYAADMLFVLNATSLQLLPTTVIALRIAAGSASPADIFLPTLLSTAFSTVLGALLVCLTRPRRKKKGRTGSAA